MSCELGSCVSEYPALAMGLSGAVGVAALVVGVVVFRRARRGFGLRPAVVASVFVGVAALLLGWAALGFRHPGGREAVADGPTAYRCEAWYLEAGRLWHDVPASAAGCGTATRSMTIVNPLLSVAAGVVAGLVSMVVLTRRRFVLDKDLRLVSGG